MERRLQSKVQIVDVCVGGRVGLFLTRSTSTDFVITINLSNSTKKKTFTLVLRAGYKSLQ